MFSSEKEDWGTPQEVFDALDQEFCFKLDAAAAKHNAKCPVYFDITDDALTQSWHPFESIFLNPPYSRQIGKWVAKAREEADKGATVVLLIPARTDTRWWHDYVYKISETRFLKGRLKFVSKKKTSNAATFPSVIIVMRPTDRKRIKTMTKHFTHIRSNVKVPVDAELKQLNLVVGDNRSGKSSVVSDAIRLALTGKHPMGHHASQLANLAPKDADQLYVELTNGTSEAKFYVDNLQSKPKKPRHSSPFEGQLPLALASEILSFDRSKAREAIFSRFGSMKSIPTPKALDTAQKSLWKTGVKEVKGADAAEKLAELAKWMRKEKLARGREVKALEKEIESLRLIDTAGIEEIGSLESQLEAAQQYEGQQKSRALTKDYEGQVERLTAAIKGHEAQVSQKREKLSKAQSILTQTASEAEKLQRAKVALGIIERIIEAGEGVTCPICVSPCDAQRMLEARKSAQETITLREQQCTQYSQAKEAVEILGNELEGLEKDIKDAHARILGAHQAIGALSEGSADYDGPSSADLQDRLRELRQLEVSRAQQDEKAEARRDAKKKAAIAKDLEKEAGRLLQDLLAGVKTKAETAVNKYMPDNFQVELNLEGDLCEWVVIGDDNRAHSKAAMAGSERAALVVGLALAWTEGQDSRVLSLDDESLSMLSPKNLQALLEKVEDAANTDPTLQVFAAWPAARIDHVADIPKNWNVLRIGE